MVKNSMLGLSVAITAEVSTICKKKGMPNNTRNNCQCFNTKSFFMLRRLKSQMREPIILSNI